MPRKKEDNEKRDKDVYDYYCNLISAAVGYTPCRAKQLVQERFSLHNLSIRRIENIIATEKKNTGRIRHV